MTGVSGTAHRDSRRFGGLARVAAGGAAVIVAAAGFAAAYRTTYHVWPGQAAGSRVHWCDRDYEHGSAAALSLREATASSTLPLRVVAGYPPLGPRQQLLAVSMAGQAAPCPTVVFLKAGPDSYLPYSMLGGP